MSGMELNGGDGSGSEWIRTGFRIGAGYMPAFL